LGHSTVSGILRFVLLAPIAVLWAYHLSQRRYDEEIGGKKRMATLMLTVFLLGLWVLTFLFWRLGIDDVFLIPICFLAAAVLYWRRKALFPYRLACARCGKSLPLKKILFFDSNACDTCDPPRIDA
jgi:hypothetical protein